MKNRRTASRDKCLVTVQVMVLFCILISLISPASAGEIKSRAAVVMDSVTGRVLYAKNPDIRLMPASTTKLMTALVVIEKANLRDVFTVSRNAVHTSPTRSGLKEGDSVTVEALLYAALMKSANDAAVALAEGVAGSEEEFVKLMNRKAVAIGADDTHFINASGLPGQGQYITAYDLAKIMRQAIKFPVLKEILGTRITEVSAENGKPLFIRNTNKLLWSDDELLGGKTGYTRQARHCFVCAGERDSDTIIAALLGAPSRDILWKESEELMAFGSRVMNKTEEPVVYMTRMERDRSGMARVSYDGNGGDGGETRKYRKKQGKKKKGKDLRGGSSLAKGKGKKGPSAKLAQHKPSRKKPAKQVAKHRKMKRSHIAKKGEYGVKG